MEYCAEARGSHWYLRQPAARLSPVRQAPPDLHCGHRLVFDICISTANWIRPASRRSSQACATCTPRHTGTCNRPDNITPLASLVRVASGISGSGSDSRARCSLWCVVVTAEICQGPGTVMLIRTPPTECPARHDPISQTARRRRPRPRQVPPYPMCIAKPP